MIGPVRCLPACDDQVHVRVAHPINEEMDDLRRMLQVSVHHADPGGPRPLHAGQHRSAQPAAAIAALTVQKRDLERRSLSERLHDVRRGVFAVVDDDHLQRRADPEPLQAFDQGLDVLGFVLGWDHDRDERDGGAGAAVRSCVVGSLGAHVRARREATFSLMCSDCHRSTPRCYSWWLFE